MTVTKKLIGRLPVLIGEYDSTKTYSKRQRVTLYGSEFESKVDNNNAAPATLSNGTLTINTDSWRVVSNGTEAFLAGEKIKQLEIYDTETYLSATVDADGKEIETLDSNGKKTFHSDVEVKGNLKKDGKNVLLEKDGKALIDETFANSVNTLDDEENIISIETDNNNKVVSYRDTNGTKHELVGLSTKTLQVENINLTEKNASDLAYSLSKGGYMVTDWSQADEVHIAIPACARVNITSSDGTAATWPTKKTDNKKYWLEFWDMNGNYFKKRIIFNAQGSSSMYFPKRNGAIDLCNDEWIGDDTFKVTFGKWVPQDSFHLKAFYNDGTKSLGAVAYQLFDEVSQKIYTPYNNRTYKRALLNFTNSGNVGIDDGNELNINFDGGARCFPDMFPCIVYLDSKFYGIYSFALKKHRDNYHMEKDNPKHIHIGAGTWIPFENGDIQWNRFELRNPKKLFYQIPQTINGTQTLEYDGDHCAEIMGEDSEYYLKNLDGTDASSKVIKQMKICAEVKKHIIDAHTKWTEFLTYAAENSASNDEIRNKLKSMFDIDGLIDYILMCNILGNGDSWHRNCQWTTWNGEKWFINPYDWDSWAGSGLAAYAVPASYSKYISVIFLKNMPYYFIQTYFKNEMNSRWTELKNNNILTSNHIVSLFISYMQRFGLDAFKLEYSKWNESPGWRDSKLNSDYWVVNPKNPGPTEINYDSTKTYNKGDTCSYGKSGTIYWFDCLKDNTIGKEPVTGSYKTPPHILGFHESIYRIKNWLDEMISWADSAFK